MKKFEVTIPIKPGPWFTGYAMASDKQTAISLVTREARQFGFNGKMGRAQVLEVK